VELSYESADARVRAIGGTSAEHLRLFVTWLGSQQYSVGYVCIVARHALAFGRWCEGRGIAFDALTDDDIDRYQRSRARLRSRRAETRRQERRVLMLLLHFLRKQGICAAAPACTTAVDRVTADFAQHLRRNRALAPITVERYTRLTGQFLAWRFGQAEVCLHDLRPTDAIAFVRHESRRLAPSALKGVANALRSFLRFGEFRGEITAALATGVPSVATWTTTPPVPKAIAAAHAQRAIASCDSLTAVGRRDRAVLLLLARLGLRACEIIRLTLDDIDWDQSQLRVRGKGGRESLMPLPVDVGAAIVAYLEEVFPTPPLQPETAQGRARMNQWISAVNSYYYPYMCYHVSHERNVFPELGIASDEAVVSHALPKIEVGLQVAERQLSHGQGFLLGGEVGLADYYLLPSTYAFGFAPEAKAMYADFPAVREWREKMEALPTVQRFRAAQPPRGPIEHARKWAISHRPKY